MSEDQPSDIQIAHVRPGNIQPLRPAAVVPRPSEGAAQKPVPETVTFDRHELREILNLYGRKVAEGEWRDYAIDFSKDGAVTRASA